MIRKIMKRYALSEKGAKDFIKATCLAALTNISHLPPVAILYFLIVGLLNGNVGASQCYWYCSGLLVSFALTVAFSYFEYNAEFYTTYKESEKRRVSLAETLRRLHLSFFGKRDVADLTKVILQDTQVLEQSFSHYMPQFFGSLISTPTTIIALLFFDWRMAFASMWVYPVSLFIVLFSNKIQNIFNRKKDIQVLKVNEDIQEYIELLKDYKSYSCQNEKLIPIKSGIDNIIKRSVFAELGVAQFVLSAQAVIKLGLVTVVLAGSYLLIANALSVEVFIFFLLLVSRVYEPMSGGLVNLGAVISQDVNISRMNELYDYSVQEGRNDIEVNNYDIELRNVSFSYEDDIKVLDDVSIKINADEVTALVGPSGGGKSTIGKLIARFYDIQQGTITLGGKDISKIDPECLMSNYSIVFQDVVLFNNTVLENIRIGNRNATDKEVLYAAKLACCDEFVSKLNNGYKTMIGENGLMLSGGERQRIAIARALLKNAPVLILDEATASLDAENESYVQEAISNLSKGKTIVVIAHRLRTIESADKIIFIDHGKVVESGTPAELLANPDSRFSKMKHNQIQEC